jgi:hypothetical protein
MKLPDPYFVSDHFAGKKSNRLGSLSAFAGIVTRKIALILNLKSSAPIKDGRILHAERVSANRFHQEVKLTSPADSDPIRLGWLKSADEMSGSSS